MHIYNAGNYFSDKQLIDITKLISKKALPNKLIVCEYRKDLFKLLQQINISNALSLLFNITYWSGGTEGVYIQDIDTVIIFIFSENDDGEDKHSKQLYSLHALMHELRHVWQNKTKFQGDEEVDSDRFATKFIKKNSKSISKIMEWEDEWEVEED